TIWQTPRRLSWLAALLVALVLPVILATGLGSNRQPRHTAEVFHSTVPHVSIALTTESISPTATVSGPVRRARPVEAREALVAMEPYFVALWLLSSTLVLVVLCAGAIRIGSATRRWREMDIDGLRVLISPRTGPAVVGVLRPRIVFPEWALSLDARARRLMLLHETEHIRARDPYLLLLATLSVLFAPWNVALWFIARRLRLAVELDCDRRVVRASGDAGEYGRLLLDVGARRGTNPPIGASLVERRSFLARRITTMIANNPRHTVLNSLPLVMCIALVSMAAARVPRPEPFARGRVSLRGASSKVTQLGTADRQGSYTTPQHAAVTSHLAAAATRPSRTSSRMSTLETPRITVDYENAPIEDVVAAFAKFAGRKIRLSKGVSGSVTAHIVDRPWDEALAWIVGAIGHHLVILPDSAIVISSIATPSPRSAARLGRLPRGTAAQDEATVATATPGLTNRSIVGRVLDDSTNLPIAGTEINVIGPQAIGQPNRACTSQHGEFELVVPDGEVWLDASAGGYEFSRVTLGSTDTIALFRGRRTLPPSVARVGRAQIESVEVLKGAAATALYGPAAANGVVVIGTKRPELRFSIGGIWFFKPPSSERSAPLFVVDGVVVGPSALDVTTSCEQR
ncbi:MAG TPA: M56 family metallopeptidase, partial [Gemmatimonadaceae bacterium]|nr:M56 family metallopeptidase [Gemmatimonadaceae bacterium]